MGDKIRGSKLILVRTSIAPDTGLDEEEEEGDDMNPEQNGSHYRSSSPIPIPENKEMISVTVKMVADPLSLPEGASENAIRLYTKPRTIRTYKVSPGGDTCIAEADAGHSGRQPCLPVGCRGGEDQS